VLWPGAVAGHGDHDHAEQRLTGVQAAARARDWIDVLSKRGKVGPDWAGLEPACVHLTGNAPDEEWMATFRDPDPDSGARGAGLTIFLDLDGAYLRSAFVDGDGNPATRPADASRLPPAHRPPTPAHEGP
jgi:hypothetical protein